jgi:hypothetical protein
VKLIGKLHDGTIFTKKGHDEEPFEFKIDEGIGNFFFLFLSNLSLVRVYASMLIFLDFLSLVIFR